MQPLQIQLKLMLTFNNIISKLYNLTFTKCSNQNFHVLVDNMIDVIIHKTFRCLIFSMNMSIYFDGVLIFHLKV